MSGCSTEQQDVIDNVRERCVVVVDAVAGSGKTTTILGLAQTFTDKKIIQITYNSQLKLEVRQKVVQMGLNNLEIHTYHSLVVNYYDPEGHEDQGINLVVTADTIPHTELPQCDILVIDESQDMTKLYFDLIKKLLRDINNENIALVILGDKFQGIYDFKEADTRFLTCAANLWNKFEPVNKELSTSYRVTEPIAWFVNNVLVGQQRIHSTKSGPPVYYIRHNVWKAHELFFPLIMDLLKSPDIGPGDIFVLSSSLRGKSSFVVLENCLVRHGVKCYVPKSEEQRLSTETIKGKVVFSTFHQSKGRERKIVIIYGFDSSYFEYYARSAPTDVCPPVLYVAVTRASQQLILLADVNQTPLPFLHCNEVAFSQSPNVKFFGEPCSQKYDHEHLEDDSIFVTANTLVRYIKEPIITRINPLINKLFTVVRENNNIVDIPTVITCDGTFEDVSVINGIAITALFADRQHKNLYIPTFLKNVQLSNKHSFLLSAIDKVKRGTPADYLYMANVYQSVNTRLYHSLAQISSYDWLTQEMVDLCCENIKTAMPDVPEYKVQLENAKYKCDYGLVTMAGTVDAYTKNTVWEFKCTEKLSVEHLLQVVVHAWIYHLKKGEQREFKILNIRTGKVMQLELDYSLIQKVVDTLLENKFAKPTRKTDQEFIEKCIKVN